jgi:DNA helicase-2/ATP-dependent DNA helicase PcrA
MIGSSCTYSIETRESRSTGTKGELMQALKTDWPEARWNMTKTQLCALAYHRHLVRCQVIDFDSVLTMGIALLQRTEGWVMIGRHPLLHLLVDEVQDSSPQDHEVYRLMPVETLTMVGDINQSLFRFRGGAPELMANLCRDPEFQLHKLTVNHRSTEPIVEVANLVVRNSPVPMAMESARGPGAPVEVHGFETIGQESMWIAQQVLSGSTQDCAVLVRTNHLVRQYADALVAAGVPVQRRVQVRFPEDWGRCRLALAVLNDPENDWLASRWLTACGQDGAAALDEAAGEAVSVNRLKIGMKRCEAVSDLPGRLVSLGVSRSSVELMVQIAETDGAGTLGDLVDAIADHMDDTQQVGEGVFVGTIHSAKGREWDTVFLPAFEDEVIPANRDLEEERRVVFVAASRARNRLCITGVDQRVDQFKGRREATWSRFLEEMGLAAQ